jgi:hypothetical protein
MSIISFLFYQSNCCHFIYTFVIMLLFNNCHISHIHDLKKIIKSLLILQKADLLASLLIPLIPKDKFK